MLAGPRSALRAFARFRYRVSIIEVYRPAQLQQVRRLSETRVYQFEKQKLSKIAQEIQRQNAENTRPNHWNEADLMAPRRAPAKKPAVGRDGKPISNEPRPSASILLISPQNQILLLHRVKTSSSFASAHVFPGGNLEAAQDGSIPEPSSPLRHVDSNVYRLGAIRECFEESGILLARSKKNNEMLVLPPAELEEARKGIHANTLNFAKWVDEKGGVPDVDALIPFTRWITPLNVPRRFTTQMYVYFYPVSAPATGALLKTGGKDETALVATDDGGKEHTEAVFRSCEAWCNMAQKGEVILFPPQFYLIWLLGKFLQPSQGSVEEQRAKAREFLKGSGANGVPWADKCISPQTIGMWQGRAVLDLSVPGPELKVSDRKGETGEVVLVKFSKEGPREVNVRERKEVLDGMRRERAEKEAAKSKI